MRVHPFDPPINPGMGCRNCGDPLLVTGRVSDNGMVISGIREYVYTHAHGSEQCRPKTKAQPFDAWQVTTKVQAIQAERDAEQDALYYAGEATA